MPVGHRFRRALSYVSAALVVSGLAAPAVTAAPPPYHPWLSSAGELLFREELAQGHYLDHPLARWYSQSTWSEDGFPTSPDEGVRSGETPAATAFGLALDARVNDRVPATCAACNNLQITQCEPTVAADGPNVLVGWNDYEPNSCGGPPGRQNYGYSTDGGVTFIDGNGYPQSDVGSRLSGDPVHAVNHKTGAFYVGGLTGGGLGGVKGHFEGPSFVIDTNIRAVTAIPAVEFFDKPWINADSLSGNVYFTWSNFVQYGVSRIEFQAFDKDLNPIGPRLSLSDTSALSCGSQFSQIAIGPNGEVWVSWLQYHCPTARTLFIVRRSDDFGASFGPPQLIRDYMANSFNGPPGMQRFFASYQSTLTADCSHGPHRGRVYAAWDECLRLPVGPGGVNSTMEVELNGTYLTATHFTPGDKIRGVLKPTDKDWWSYDMVKGETFYLYTDFDSMPTAFNARLWCLPAGGIVPTLLANGTTSQMLFSAPHSGTYYLQVYATNTDSIPYYFITRDLTPSPGDIARDHRDQFLSWSDDGITWSTPHRLNDSDQGFDGIFPTLAVDARGRVHAFWLDFREDLECGAASTEYITSSGDGGVTWGPNRRLGDAVAFWPLNVCVGSSGNTQGDYIHMAANGDQVVAAFTATPLGDPDIWIDPSNRHAVVGCTAEFRGTTGRDTVVAIPFVNQGNYARELNWRLVESKGWLTGVDPAASGLTTLAVGETLWVRANIHLDACLGDSTYVRFMNSDPDIPGYEDTCTTLVRCTDGQVSALATLMSSSATSDEVTLEWYVPEVGGSPVRVWRREAESESVPIGPPEHVGAERWRFVDRGVTVGTRYGYRLETPAEEGPSFSAESWIDVPVPSTFALAGLRPNPASGDLFVAFSLPASAPAKLEIFDLSGRRLLSQEVGGMGTGAHQLRLTEGRRLASGVYTIRLSQRAHVVSMRAVVVR